VPPSTKITLPHRNFAWLPSMNTTHAAMSAGSPYPPMGTGKLSMPLASSGSSSCPCSSGVMMAPGAMALTRMPCPAHCSLVPLMRSQCVTAIFDPA
jgi:hypothetical protein